ncbi:MAG: SLBB domain-containing protein [Armatimonadetes bacterium]|nr:SLBB domain-containing protein [Armatimonadota bacterium]
MPNPYNRLLRFGAKVRCASVSLGVFLALLSVANAQTQSPAYSNPGYGYNYYGYTYSPGYPPPYAMPPVRYTGQPWQYPAPGVNSYPPASATPQFLPPQYYSGPQYYFVYPPAAIAPPGSYGVPAPAPSGSIAPPAVPQVSYPAPQPPSPFALQPSQPGASATSPSQSTAGQPPQPQPLPIYPPAVSTGAQPLSAPGALQPGLLQPSQPPQTQVSAPSVTPSVQPPQPQPQPQQAPVLSSPVLLPPGPQGLQVTPFGYDFFNAGSEGFQPIPNLPAPAEYPLGPGDYVRVILTSPVGQETNLQLLVDALGRVQIPNVGLIKVSGMTVLGAQQAIAGQVRAKFPALMTQVALSSIRPIQVFVIGEVKKPGSYVLPGLSTLLNALYSAGGPSMTGSLRTIRVERNKQTLATVDLYDILLKGDRSKDLTLQSGDSVFVPALGPTVTVLGEVRRPAIYEINGPTDVGDVLRMAGGASGLASLSDVRIERVVGSTKKIMMDLALSSPTAPDWRIPLQNGDSVLVRPVLDDAANRVEIIGHVKRPGAYELSDAMTLSALVQRAEGFDDTEIFLDRATVIRVTPDGGTQLLSANLRGAMAREASQDIALQPRDRVIIYSLEEAASLNRTVGIEGEVSRPGVYERKENMRLRDLIIAAGGAKPEAYGVVEIGRADPAENGQLQVLTVNLAKAMDGAETDNLILQDRDQVSVRNRRDAQVQAEVVYLAGEVKYPGPYALTARGEKLSSLIARAGGLTGDAFAEGAIFARDTSVVLAERQVDIAADIQQGLDKLSDELRTLELAKYGIRAPAVSTPSVSTGNTTLAATSVLTNIADQSRGAQAGPRGEVMLDQPRTVEQVSRTSRLTIHLTSALAHPGSEDDIPLEAGDKLVVPKKPLVVSVAGAVINPSVVVYRPGQRIDDYVKRVGNYARDADKKNVVVVRANGDIAPRSSVREVELGDIIIVPAKALTAPRNRWDGISEIARIVGNVAIAAALIAK